MFCSQSYQLEVLFAQFFWLLLFLFLPPCNYSTLRDRTLELPILPGEGVFFLFLFFFRIGFCLGIIKHQAAFLSSSQVFAQYLCGVWGRGFKKVFSFFLDKHGDLTGLGVGGWGTPRAALAGWSSLGSWRRHGSHEPARTCGGELPKHALPHHAQPQQCHPQHFHRGEWATRAGWVSWVASGVMGAGDLLGFLEVWPYSGLWALGIG